MTGQMASTMDLYELIKAEVDRTSIRRVADKAGLNSKAPIERILKGPQEGFPELETLLGISEGFGIDLLEVVRMAGATIPEPKTPAEVQQRLGGLVTQVPSLDQLVADLRDVYVRDPSFVSGMIVGIETSLADWRRRNDAGESDQQGEQ